MKRWRSAGELRVPRDYVFSEKGIEVVAETFSSAFAWELVSTARLSGGQVLLETLQNQYFIVPTTSFRSPADWKAFLSLVNRKVRGADLKS